MKNGVAGTAPTERVYATFETAWRYNTQGS